MAHPNEPKRPRKILGMNSRLSAHETISSDSEYTTNNCAVKFWDNFQYNIPSQNLNNDCSKEAAIQSMLALSSFGIPYPLLQGFTCVPHIQAFPNFNFQPLYIHPNTNNEDPNKMTVELEVVNGIESKMNSFHVEDDNTDSSSCSTPSTIKCDARCEFLSQEKYEQLKTLAISACDVAEKLAYIHRCRPCFKKIDSLCLRMKEELLRPDNVMFNINSQGIGWAVKDFIFVFTRIINAWVIIKGYVYNTPEGLNKVRSALSPDFDRSFIAWQDTTLDFIDNLMKSFINLEQLNKSQMKCSNEDSVDFDKKSELIKEETPPANPPEAEKVFDFSFDKVCPNISNIYDILSPNIINVKKTVNSDVLRMEMFASEILSTPVNGIWTKHGGGELANQLNSLKNRFLNMRNADIFLKKQFCRNHFPDFIFNTPDFLDLHSIISKCEAGLYDDVFQVVHDINHMIHQVKLFLIETPDSDLQISIMAYEYEIKQILSEEVFKK